MDAMRSIYTTSPPGEGVVGQADTPRGSVQLISWAVEQVDGARTQTTRGLGRLAHAVIYGNLKLRHLTRELLQLGFQQV